MLQAVTAAALLFLLVPTDAHAMHISDGILPFNWAALWYAVAAPFVLYGLFRLKRESRESARLKPLIGMVGAAVFVISCMPIPVPLAGTCSHPAGTAMAAILIGPLYSVVAASVSLLLQALFLSHGGITTLGANITSMGIAGSFAGYAAFKGLEKAGAPVLIAAFVAGVVGDWATYSVTSLELASALHAPGAFMSSLKMIVLAFAPVQIPIGILEGVITAGAYKFLVSRRPEIFQGRASGAQA